MRIYINTTTVQDTADLVVNELVKADVLTHEEGEEARKIEPVDHLANFSVDVCQGLPGRPSHVIIEINDEIFFKYARTYVKVIRFIAPFIKPAQAFLAVLKDEMQDIERFLLQRK